VVVYAYKLPAKAQLDRQSSAEPPKAQWRRCASPTAQQIPSSRGTRYLLMERQRGTQFIAADLDHDGDLDSPAQETRRARTRKSQGEQRSKNVREETQPLERKWPFLVRAKSSQEDAYSVSQSLHTAFRCSM